MRTTTDYNVIESFYSKEHIINDIVDNYIDSILMSDLEYMDLQYLYKLDEFEEGNPNLEVDLDQLSYAVIEEDKGYRLKIKFKTKNKD